MEQVRAAVLEARGQPFRLAEVRLPEPGPGEILVEIAAAGICHTDLAFRDLEFGTPLPMVLGHEGAGTIVATGPDVTGLAPGDRVALSYDSCGACGPCGEGAPQYCAHWALRNIAGVTDAMAPPLAFADGRPLFGRFFGQSSFATRAIAHVRNTVRIPDALPFHLAAPLGCGMQTGAGAVAHTAAARAGESLLVFGAGAVGLAAVMMARELGLGPIIAVDRVPARLELARELGATHALAGEPGLAEALAGIVPALPPATGAALDIAIDTTGVPELIEAGIAALGTRGRMVLVGITPPGVSAAFQPGSFLGGKRIIGTIEGDADPRAFVPRLAELHLAGRFPHDRLVRTYDFAAINAAAHAMESGETVKPVLLMR